MWDYNDETSEKRLLSKHRQDAADNLYKFKSFGFVNFDAIDKHTDVKQEYIEHNTKIPTLTKYMKDFADQLDGIRLLFLFPFAIISYYIQRYRMKKYFNKNSEYFV